MDFCLPAVEKVPISVSICGVSIHMSPTPDQNLLTVSDKNLPIAFESGSKVKVIENVSGVLQLLQVGYLFCKKARKKHQHKYLTSLQSPLIVFQTDEDFRTAAVERLIAGRNSLNGRVC